MKIFLKIVHVRKYSQQNLSSAKICFVPGVRDHFSKEKIVWIIEFLKPCWTHWFDKAKIESHFLSLMDHCARSFLSLSCSMSTKLIYNVKDLFKVLRRASQKNTFWNVQFSATFLKKVVSAYSQKTVVL